MLREERGFTLIELLIVMLLIAVLAAVAIPMFAGKKDLAHASEAKSNARNLVTHVDSCYTATDDFARCQTQAQIEAESLPWGAGPGEVRVKNADADSYEVEAVTRTGATFVIERAIGAPTERTCNGSAGCKDGTW